MQLQDRLTHSDDLDLLDEAIQSVVEAQVDILANMSADYDIYKEIETKYDEMTDEEAAALDAALSYASVYSPRNPLDNFLARHLQGRRTPRMGERPRHRRSSSAQEYERTIEDILNARRIKRTYTAGEEMSNEERLMLEKIRRSSRAGSMLSPRQRHSPLSNGVELDRRTPIVSKSQRNSLAMSPPSPRRATVELPSLSWISERDSRRSIKLPELTLYRLNSESGKYLEKVNTWHEFDIWAFNDATNERPLSTLFLHLFDVHDLYSRCNIKKGIAANFITKIEEGYLDNPYHNKVHAADVLQSMHFWLQSSVLKPVCDKYPLLRLSSYIAAAVHDYKHPGTNNLFQQRTGSEEALTYNDNSVLENMHVSRAFKLMRKHIKYNILADLKKEDQGLVRKLVISLVLQTDMAKHADGIRGLQRKTQYKLEAKAKWMDNSNPENSKDFLDDAELLLGIALKCSDLCNPCRPKRQMLQWASRINQEFFKQGDLEQIFSLPVGPGNDRNSANIPLGQQFFIKVIILTLLSGVYTNRLSILGISKSSLYSLEKSCPRDPNSTSVSPI